MGDAVAVRKVSFRRFTMPSGDEFVIRHPHYCAVEGMEGWDNKTTVLIESMMLEIICDLRKTPEDKRWFEVEMDAEGNIAFEHSRRVLLGRVFAHGAIDVLVIAGPTFDAVKVEQLSNWPESCDAQPV